MKVKSMVCSILGHIFILKPKPDILSKKRICKRCSKKQNRVNYPVFGVDDIWVDSINGGTSTV